MLRQIGSIQIGLDIPCLSKCDRKWAPTLFFPRIFFSPHFTTKIPSSYQYNPLSLVLDFFFEIFSQISMLSKQFLAQIPVVCYTNFYRMFLCIKKSKSVDALLGSVSQVFLNLLKMCDIFLCKWWSIVDQPRIFIWLKSGTVRIIFNAQICILYTTSFFSLRILLGKCFAPGFEYVSKCLSSFAEIL